MKTVLIVEDEEQLGMALCHFVRTAYPGQIDCVQKGSGEEAIEYLLSEDADGIEVIFVDLQLDGGMDGREFVRTAIAMNERFLGRIAVCSGETLSDADPLFGVFGCARFDKPFELDSLRKFIHERAERG